jgi:hypothetical protein
LAHEAVRRLQAQPLAQQKSQGPEQGVQGCRGREGPEPQDAPLWLQA